MFGIVFNGFKLVLIAVASALEGVVTAIAKMDPNHKIGYVLTPDDIIFNQVGLTNINFFDFQNVGDVVLNIRKNVASWYYGLRTLSVAILLAVLIFIGVRLAITSVASERAKYLEMLKNWAVSFALLFLLHYIIVGVIQLNNELIDIFYRGPYAGGAINKGGYETIIGSLIPKMIDPRIFKSFAAILLYYFVIGTTIAFLFNYIKRFLTIGFLILISPLITITYSIDKMGDGKSQALNTWMKEFIFNVLIQPFHAILYLAFAHMAIDILAQGSSIAGLVFSFLCFKFMWDAEKIVREIFGFKNASSLGDTVASLAAMSTISKVAVGAAGKAGGVAASAASKTTFGKNLTNKVKNSNFGKGYTKLMQDWDRKIRDGRSSGKIGQEIKAELLSGVKNIAESPGKVGKTVIENAGNAVIGTMAYSLAAGANDKNAVNYGLTAFDTAKQIRDGNTEAREKIDEKESDAAKEADKYSRETGLVGQDLADKLNQLFKWGPDMLERILQSRLDAYAERMGLDKNSPDYVEKLADLYDEVNAKDLSIVMADPNATKEEKALLSAIRDKDMADKLDKTKKIYKDYKYDDPKQATKDLINDIRDQKIDFERD